ncbi:AraC family transcriptional regulator [Clostridium sp.]|uniref:AraC family transcriptional regulator n=1 Tax=Clostridium sp. TaxID=1506 RepID=UPI003216F53D
MEFLNRMTQVIDYIEEHITDDLDYSDVAQIVCCSAYQFGRIFSYVVGTSLSEYIRNRRLSLAAVDLQSKKFKVIDVAIKYGYNSPESFARAFREMHGVSPKEAFTFGVKLRLYPRITFHISIKGDVEMEYRIEEKEIIKGVGIVKNFGKWTSNNEAKNWKNRMGERWDFWDEFLYGGMNNQIAEYQLYRAPFYQMGVIHTLNNGEIEECIGAESDGEEYPTLMSFDVPASMWAVFTAKGTLNQSVHPIDALTTRIFSEWFPSSSYEKSMDYEIQVYGPGDTESDDYTCEIWIPIKEKL